MANIDELHSSSRYLTPTLVNQCFIKGQTTHTDKGLCGNGFTSGFIKIKPAENKFNILIAPNRAVVIDLYNTYKFDPRFKFFFGRNSNSEVQNPTSFEGGEILVFVIDSFLFRADKIKEISHRIDKVLIDEYHSTERESGLRSNLVFFLEKVKNICSDPNTSITTTTATPNFFSKIDIKIINKDIPKTTIYHNKDLYNSIEKIKELYTTGKNVIVLTQNTDVAYLLRNNRKNELKARFICGDKFKSTLCEKTKIIEDNQSNLTIITSSGFEGCNLYYKDAYVFFIEDRSKKHETFYISNLYQGIRRNRIKPFYIEYCRFDLSKKRKNPFKNIDNEIDNFINRTDLSIEAKQSNYINNKPNIYKDYVHFDEDNEGSFTIKKNDVAINLFKENLLYDEGIDSIHFESFLKDRNIEIKKIDSVQNKPKTKIKESTKVKNLKLNTAFIEKYDLFGSSYTLKPRVYNSKLKPTENDIRLDYLKHFKAYLRRKNYKGDRILTYRENITLSLLNDEKKFHKLLRNVIKVYNDRTNKQESEKEKREKIKKFKDRSTHIVCNLLFVFSNETIKISEKKVGHRDYNLFVEIGIRSINYIASEYGIEITEIDITSCFPRLIYALNGLVLPGDFYGENKKNKRAINVLINNFRYNPKNSTLKKVQRNNAIITFRKYGFDEKVIQWLINNFFDTKYKSDLFNYLAHKEKQLIENLKESTIWKCDGIIRRHDSILVFNNETDLDFLKEFTFLGVKNWLHYSINGNEKQLISSKKGIKNLQEMKSCTNLIPKKPTNIRAEDRCVYIYNYINTLQQNEIEINEDTLTELINEYTRLKANQYEYKLYSNGYDHHQPTINTSRK